MQYDLVIGLAVSHIAMACSLLSWLGDRAAGWIGVRVRGQPANFSCDATPTGRPDYPTLTDKSTGRRFFQIMPDSRIKITIQIEAENVDELVREVLERFGLERRPASKPTLRIEDTPPAVSIPFPPRRRNR